MNLIFCETGQKKMRGVYVINYSIIQKELIHYEMTNAMNTTPLHSSSSHTLLTDQACIRSRRDEPHAADSGLQQRQGGGLLQKPITTSLSTHLYGSLGVRGGGWEGGNTGMGRGFF